MAGWVFSYSAAFLGAPVGTLALEDWQVGLLLPVRCPAGSCLLAFPQAGWRGWLGEDCRGTAVGCALWNNLLQLPQVRVAPRIGFA